MFILHVALQGCLKARDIQYGLTVDTGGHIRYLLELVNASVRDDAVSRVVMATRRFASPLGEIYDTPRESVGPKTEILRFATPTEGYVTKEEMWREVPAFADALVRWIEAQPVRPDVIHAHYADAGVVASIVEERLGIPFVFVAHSLGRVKLAVQAPRPGSAEAENMLKRIASEERSLARASLVVASSRDEAEVQYAGYDAYDPGRIRILAPGSDLAAFEAARCSPQIAEEMARFLREPEKPVILAIARPVRKKNLTALVRAYGETPALQEMANLVIVAGSRDNIETMDAEMAGEMAEILRLIDAYDLYGRVAYPKSHRPEDVPAIYAHAFERGGLFANPALNEPFGLTLLEASAAGLPLVATDSGGPNDIVETCGNGLLVDPNETAAIAEACLKVLSDKALWQRYSAAGRQAVHHYDWARHAERYHALLRALIEGRRSLATTSKLKAPALRREIASPQMQEQLLVCDIDNTLVGCADSIGRFGDWHRAQEGLSFGVATGRSFHSAMDILEQQEAPRPQVMITSVGSEIYHLEPGGLTYRLDPLWRRIVSQGWDKEAVAAALEGMTGIRPQSPLEQRSHKLSFFSDGSRGTVRRIRSRLERHGLACSIIHSHAKYLDILPSRASKGAAVEFVRRRLDLAKDAVFVAGDSGNDIEMLKSLPQAIIVANFSDDLANLPALAHSYVARQKYALGIIEGVDHFREKARAAWVSQH